MKGGVFVAVLIAFLAFFSLAAVRPCRAAVSCGAVDVNLAPCINYLTGKESTPPTKCCDGVKAVKALAQTTEDKRACCGCLKAAANRYADLKDDAAQSLPKTCGVQLDIPISRTVDCSKIN